MIPPRRYGRDRGRSRVPGEMSDAAGLLATSERQSRELALLRRLRTSLAGEREVSAIMRTAASACHEQFGFRHVALAMVDGDDLVLQGYVGLRDAIRRLPLTSGVSGRVVRTGVAAFVPDVSKDPDYVSPAEDSETRSLVAVPLRDQGRVVGVLAIEGDHHHPLQADDLNLATAVAEHIGLALERARLGQDVQISAERYRTLVEQGPAILYEVDLREVGTPIRFISAHVEDVVGYPASAWKDDPFFWRALVHPDDRERRTAAVAHGDRIGYLDDLEYRVITRDGRIRWVRERARPCPGPDGEATFWQGLIVDISADREVASERELRIQAVEARQRLANTLESITDSFIALDTGWRYTYVNRNAAELCGEEPAALIGRVFWERFPELRGGEFDDRFRRAMHEQRAASFEAFFDHYGLWLDVRLYPSETGLAVYFRDVSERREAEVVARRSEDRFRSLVQNATDLIAIFCPDGTAKYLSPAVNRLFGVPEGETVIDNVFEDVHPDDLPRVREAVTEVVSDATVVRTCLLRSSHQGGPWLWIEVVFSNRIEDPAIEGIVANARDVSERMEAEHRLVDAERRYRTLVEQLPAVTYQQPVNGDGVTYVSPQIADLFGYPAARFVAEPRFWSTLTHPDDVERVLAAERLADELGTPFKAIYRQIAADGRVIWVSDQTLPIRDAETGEIQSWQGFLIDVTERIEAEEALRRSEVRFRALVQNASDGIAVVDANGRATYVSPTAQVLLGLSDDDLARESPFAALDQADVAAARNAIASLYADPARPVTISARRQTGDTCTYLETVASNHLDDPNVRGIVLNVRDITARRVAEQAMIEAEARFRSIVQHASDVISIHDSSGRRRWVSPSVTRMLGYDPDELTRETQLEIVHPDDAVRLRDHVGAISQATAGTNPAEFRFLHRNGSIRYLEVSGMNLLADPAVNGLVLTSRDITERRIAEARERDAEQRFRVLVEQSPAAVYTAAPGGGLVFTYVSPQIESLLGYPIHSWIAGGATFWAETIHFLDRPRTLAACAEILSSGVGGTMEYRQRTRDGREVWIRNEITCIRDDAGPPLYWLGVIVDVSDRRAAEDARVRSAEAQIARHSAEAARERLHDLVQGLDAIVWEADPETFAFTFVSQRAEEYFGYPLSDWLSGPAFLSSLVAPGDIDRAIAVRRDAVAGGRSRSAEFGVQTADGRTVWVRDIVAAPDNHGRPLRGLMVDITERRHAEQALARERDLLQVLMDTSPDLIYFKDVDRRFTRVNLAAARLFGFDDPKMAIGLRDEDVFHPESAAEFRTDEELILTKGVAATRVERPRPVRTNEEHWYLTSKVPIRAADGRIVGLFGTAKEITDRRRMEDELRRAKEDAESANQAKTLFLSRMSHELRTPLNAILGFAQVMQVDPLDEDQREGVEQILSAGRHLLGLINEVLDISQIEAGGLALRVGPVSLRDVFDESLDLIAPIASKSGIAVEIRSELPDVDVVADRQRLKQILINLLSNAVKYTPAGGVVTLYSDTRPDDFIRITIEDTGPGIPPDMIPRLFEPFDRLGAEDSDIEGTGLGLAVSQRLAQAMGQSINVDSNEVSGSRFWLELPVVTSTGSVKHDSDGQLAPAIEQVG